MIGPNAVRAFHARQTPPMPMTAMRFPVTVIFERTPLENRWASERWEPVEVLPALDDRSQSGVPERLADRGGTARWSIGGQELELHRSEGEGYYLNITAPEPKVFVMWRMKEEGGDPPVFPVVVTVSYNEAARMLDGGEQVDAVTMPAQIRSWMEPFVAANYTPEPRKKIRRNDPFDEEHRRGRGR
jgi:hypothetical protein